MKINFTYSILVSTVMFFTTHQPSSAFSFGNFGDLLNKGMNFAQNHKQIVGAVEGFGMNQMRKRSPQMAGAVDSLGIEKAFQKRLMRPSPAQVMQEEEMAQEGRMPPQQQFGGEMPMEQGGFEGNGFGGEMPMEQGGFEGNGFGGEMPMEQGGFEGNGFGGEIPMEQGGFEGNGFGGEMPMEQGGFEGNGFGGEMPMEEGGFEGNGFGGEMPMEEGGFEEF